MTNSKKKFEKLWDKQTGGELIPNFIFPFISKVEQEAIYQERERILGIIEKMQIENYYDLDYGLDFDLTLEALKEKINSKK